MDARYEALRDLFAVRAVGWLRISLEDGLRNPINRKRAAAAYSAAAGDGNAMIDILLWDNELQQEARKLLDHPGPESSESPLPSELAADQAETATRAGAAIGAAVGATPQSAGNLAR